MALKVTNYFNKVKVYHHYVCELTARFIATMTHFTDFLSILKRNATTSVLLLKKKYLVRTQCFAIGHINWNGSGRKISD